MTPDPRVLLQRLIQKAIGKCPKYLRPVADDATHAPTWMRVDEFQAEVDALLVAGNDDSDNYWRSRAMEAEHDLNIAMEELRKKNPDAHCQCHACQCPASRNGNCPLTGVECAYRRAMKFFEAFFCLLLIMATSVLLYLFVAVMTNNIEYARWASRLTGVIGGVTYLRHASDQKTAK